MEAEQMGPERRRREGVGRRVFLPRERRRKRLVYSLISMKAATTQKRKSTSSASGAPQVSISKLLAAQRRPKQHKQLARRATCPGSRRVAEDSERTWRRDSRTRQVSVLSTRATGRCLPSAATSVSGDKLARGSAAEYTNKAIANEKIDTPQEVACKV